jgi:histidine ammonia-lyase
LSHIALGMIGEGKMWNPKTEKFGISSEILKEYNIEPITLQAKEGLSLINGTQFMSALASEAVYRCKMLVKQADVVAALTVEALHGSFKAFDARIHKNRPHAGQILVAQRMRELLTREKSEINEGHTKCGQVQDSYTLRCIPQVHGVVNDTLEFVNKIISTEINSATDNPMVFSDDTESDLPVTENIISCGNFHGEYPAKACDYLAIGIAELGSISERRVARLIDSSLHPHLPSFLVVEGGLNSGFMMIHVTAASLVSENKVLVHPSSSDSIPTSCNKEDHVSMGGFAARKLLDVVENVETVIAIELLCNIQALSFSKPDKTTKPLEKVHELVRKNVPFYDQDRPFDEDIEKIVTLLRTNQVWECVADHFKSE